MTGGGFETFLEEFVVLAKADANVLIKHNCFQTKIHAVSSDNDADHIIRRAFSTFRLHFEEISDGIEQIQNRLSEVIGNEWKEEYSRRNNCLPRMDKSNGARSKK